MGVSSVSNKYDWKQVYGTVTIDKKDEESGRGSLIDILEHKTKEAVFGFSESISHVLESMDRRSPYRRYRRGKNRCWICGLKLNTPEHKPYE